jgi:alpha-beta hydrolase superfamily lysophospholipase
MIRRSTHHAETADGWRLGLRRVVDDRRHNRDTRPVAIIPGYGMNTFILGFHPAGRPLEDYLAEAGFEVWSVSLRAQDGSESLGGNTDYGMIDVSVTDMSAALDAIIAGTKGQSDRVDVIGCSLGGSIVFAHFALVPGARLGSVIALGAPLRWVAIHPLLELAFWSPLVARHLRLKGTRKLASAVLPALRHVPWLLTAYIHPDHIAMDRADEIVKVIEDPNPVLNEEIAYWIKNKDLVLDGVNVTEGMRCFANPLLVLTGNADGIVPRATARFPLAWVASEETEYIEVGDEKRKFAHADLYISRHSHELVFAPIASWLADRY